MYADSYFERRYHFIWKYKCTMRLFPEDAPSLEQPVLSSFSLIMYRLPRFPRNARMPCRKCLNGHVIFQGTIHATASGHYTLPTKPHSLMLIIMQSTLHSLLPSRLLSHSSPSPVHSAFLLATSSVAAPVSALTVDSAMSTIVPLKSVAPHSEIGGRGSNQLEERSKKQWSDQ